MRPQSPLLPRSLLVVVLALSLLAVRFPAQSTVELPVPRPLPATFSSHPAEFSRITSVRELSNGSLLVLDGAERIITAITFESNSSRKVGRQGGGPREVRFPSNLLAVSQDTVWITDLANFRWLPVDANLNFGATVPFGPVGDLVLRESMLGADMMGNLYFSLDRGLAEKRSSSGYREVPVVRVRRRDWKVDTILTIIAPAGRESSSRSAGPGQIQLMTTRPLAFEDQVAIAPNGSVLVLQALTSSVKVIDASGRARQGKPLKRPVVVVDETEKAAIRAGQVVAGSIFVVGGSGTATSIRSVTPRTPRPPLQDMPRTEWPKVKPPFLRGALASPLGRVWTIRPAQSSVRERIYDVISESGDYAGAVSVLPELALIAVGRKHVYLTHTDGDGLQTIRRYPLPAFSGK